MTTTGQAVFDRALHRSSMFTSSLVSSTEVLAWLAAEQKKLYMVAAKLNPEYFGKTDVTGTRSSATDSWDISVAPGDVAALTAIRVSAIQGTITGVSADDPVHFVSKRFPGLGAPTLRCYLRGRKLFSYGTELGTGSNYVSVLELDYAELPAAPVSLAATLRLPDEWTTLPEIRLARTIAIRLREKEMVQLLDEEYGDWFKVFQEHVLTLDHGSGRPAAATVTF